MPQNPSNHRSNSEGRDGPKGRRNRSGTNPESPPASSADQTAQRTRHSEASQTDDRAQERGKEAGGQPPAGQLSEAAAANRLSPAQAASRSTLAQFRQILARAAAQKARSQPGFGRGKRSSDGRVASGQQYPDEVVAAAQIEWMAGVKPERLIARELGISPSTLTSWAEKGGWPARKNLAQAAAALISDSVVETAIDELSAGLGVPSPSLQASHDRADADAVRGMSDEALLERIADLDDVAKGALVLDAFARQLGKMLRDQQKQVDRLVGCGDELLVAFEKALKGLNSWLARLNDDPNVALKAVQQYVPTYKALASALKDVIAMQRSIYGMEGKVGNPDPPRPDDDPQGSDAARLLERAAPVQPGSYADFVREAAARGVELA